MINIFPPLILYQWAHEIFLILNCPKKTVSNHQFAFYMFAHPERYKDVHKVVKENKTI